MSADRPSPTGVRARKVSPARLAKYRVEKDAIMRAAYELIQRNGSKETSVHDVLRETGYSTRAFYRHFRSKDELVLEMYRTDSDRVAERLVAAVAAAATPIDALEAWIDQNLAVVYDARRLRHAAVLASSEVASAEGYIAVHLAGQAAQRAPLVDLLRAGKQSGAFPNASPEEDAFAVQAVVGAHMRVRMQHADTLTRAEARAHTLALFRRALGA